MKLTKISARNFKGLSFTLDLASINFLVGSNFAGKTARTDAIRLLLLGYLPELGKTNAATFGLASGREMEVSGEIDLGNGEAPLEISRLWRLKGDKVQGEDHLPEDWTEMGDLAVMLNAETYFELSDRERVAYVFSNCLVGGDLRPSLPHAVEEVLKDWFDEMPANLTPQEFLDHCLARCSEIAKNAKATADQMQKTAQGLAYLRTQDEPGKGLDALDREREGVTAEISRQQAEKGRFLAQFEAARSNRRRREQLLAETRGKPALLARLEPLRASIQTKEADLAAASPITQEEADALRDRDRESAHALADLDRQVREVAAAIVDNEVELVGIEAKERCPYCGAAGSGWKALKVSEIDSALAGLRVKFTQLTEHRALVKEDGATLSGLSRDALVAIKDRNAIERDLRNLKAECADVDSKFSAIQLKEGELDRLPAEDPAVEAAVDAAQTALNVAEDRLRAIDRDRKTAMGRASELKRLAEAETNRDKAKEDEAKAKAAVDALRAIQAKMVAAAFEPLLATANLFFSNVLKFEIAYNPDGGEIGAWRDGVWVGHRTFSGTEKALVYAAIQAALASTSQIRVMIIDELGRLDEDNVTLLVGAILAAVRDGQIDQFVGIDVRKLNLYRPDAEEKSSQIVEIA